MFLWYYISICSSSIVEVTYFLMKIISGLFNHKGMHRDKIGRSNQT